MKNYSFISLVSGLLFGVGMVVSGMVDSSKVTAFLDVFGDWKIDLAFVMGGALFVFTPMYHFVIKPRQKPLDQSTFCLSNKKTIDWKLILGASLFGLGWGIVGICPGPALASISILNIDLLGFIVAMIIGMVIVQKFQHKIV
ncbi:DUF6691 family protein [Vibrio casei]|uniref:YeeE/YedE family protein n=1 Tax=Vibrio casei TaxID=673372 RepID=A0A368LHW0_9VIBR|nr:DUF6691 family protein [Vibrio casei]RCS70216.1 YeeE/YedE family protein [Vibrio casei]SJN25597.1 Predicted transporter component [Vibrio casei]